MKNTSYQNLQAAIAGLSAILYDKAVPDSYVEKVHYILGVSVMMASNMEASVRETSMDTTPFDSNANKLSSMIFSFLDSKEEVTL
jgi:hypothetical protein